MWSMKSASQRECESVRAALERTSGAGSRDQVAAFAALLEQLPAPARQHVTDCAGCRSFVDDLLEVRGMFVDQNNGPQPGPFFMARVMATILDREREVEDKAQTWAAVPRLASRLSVLASLLLLIAGSWAYQRPAQRTTVAAVGSESSSEGLVEGGSSVMQDDLLVGVVER